MFGYSLELIGIVGFIVTLVGLFLFLVIVAVRGKADDPVAVAEHAQETSGNGASNYYYEPAVLLSPEMEAFDKALRSVVGGQLRVMFKMRLTNIVKLSASTPREYRKGAFDALAVHQVDFTLVDNMTSEVRCCIQLVEQANPKPQWMYIRRALRTANIPFVKQPILHSYNTNDIGCVIKAEMAKVKANPFVRPDPIIYTDDEHDDWDDWRNPLNPMSPFYDSADSSDPFSSHYDSHNPADAMSAFYELQDSTSTHI